MWHTSSFVLFYLANDSKKVAFVASKKVGKAVQRNRAKRLLRAIFLEFIDTHKSGYYILVAKAEILNQKYSTLKNQWKRALSKSNLLKDL